MIAAAVLIQRTWLAAELAHCDDGRRIELSDQSRDA